jgi:hypothetical protein
MSLLKEDIRPHLPNESIPTPTIIRAVLPQVSQEPGDIVQGIWLLGLQVS